MIFLGIKLVILGVFVIFIFFKGCVKFEWDDNNCKLENFGKVKILVNIFIIIIFFFYSIVKNKKEYKR